jgi:hypothetical protein
VLDGAVGQRIKSHFKAHGLAWRRAFLPQDLASWFWRPDVDAAKLGKRI